MTDNQLVQALEQLAGQIPDTGDATFQWRVLEGNDINTCPFPQMRNNATLEQILRHEGEILRWAQLQFQAQGQSANTNLAFTRDATGSVTVNVNLPDVFNQNQEVKTRIAMAFHNVFDPYMRSRTIDHKLPPLAEFNQRREETVTRLEELQAKLLCDSEAHLRRLEEVLERDRDRLEKIYLQKQQQRDAEYAAQAAELLQREKELEARSKALDSLDQSAPISLTRETEHRTLPGKIACAILLAALAAASAWSFYKTTQPTSDGEPYWFAMARLAIAFAALCWCLAFYVRWQNRWTELCAQQELRLKRLAWKWRTREVPQHHRLTPD